MKVRTYSSPNFCITWLIYYPQPVVLLAKLGMRTDCLGKNENCANISDIFVHIWFLIVYNRAADYAYSAEALSIISTQQLREFGVTYFISYI